MFVWTLPATEEFVDADAEIEKSAFEMSKNTLPAASILMRACVVLTFGTVMISEPSFGVDDKTSIGNVLPPSADRKILTFAALTGELFVFATFQVTVCAELPVHETFKSGAVTTKDRCFRQR